MADPVNLNRFRKQKTRADKKARAKENTVKFGRTKAEKRLDDTRRDQASTRLDAHKRDVSNPDRTSEQ